MGAQSFEDLIVWPKAMDLVEAIYRSTASLPADERFGLTQQLRRAAVSISSNIAEGQGRSTPIDFLRFLFIARGSLNEVRTQLLIAVRLRFLAELAVSQLMAQCDEVKRLLSGLISSIESRKRGDDSLRS